MSLILVESVMTGWFETPALQISPFWLHSYCYVWSVGNQSSLVANWVECSGCSVDLHVVCGWYLSQGGLVCAHKSPFLHTNAIWTISLNQKVNHQCMFIDLPKFYPCSSPVLCAYRKTRTDVNHDRIYMIKGGHTLAATTHSPVKHVSFKDSNTTSICTAYVLLCTNNSQCTNTYYIVLKFHILSKNISKIKADTCWKGWLEVCQCRLYVWRYVTLSVLLILCLRHHRIPSTVVSVRPFCGLYQSLDIC